jgi:hypothetical protein
MIDYTNNLEAIERAKNAKISRALSLYEDIQDRIDNEAFRLKDVIESCNCLTRWPYSSKNRNPHMDYLARVRHGKSGLKMLEELGMIHYDPKTRTYSVNHHSLNVAKIEFSGSESDEEFILDYLDDAEEIDPTDEYLQEFKRCDDYARNYYR